LRPQNPEFSGVELEYELTGIIGRRMEQGGVERLVVLGVTFELAGASP